MRFALVDAEKASIPVAALCRIPKISRSGYYAWCKRPESAHALRDRQLRVHVHASFEASKKRYGSPRVWEDLVEEKIETVDGMIAIPDAPGLGFTVREDFLAAHAVDVR